MKKTYLTLLIIIAAVAVGVIIYRWKTVRLKAEDKAEILAEESEEEPPPPVINYLYGIPSDSFMIETGHVDRNQPLSLLLEKYGITNRQIHDIDVKARGIFDTRKFRRGNPYTAFLEGDSVKTLDYLVYEHSPVDYVVFRFKDSLDVWNGTKDIDTVRKNFCHDHSDLAVERHDRSACQSHAGSAAVGDLCLVDRLFRTPEGRQHPGGLR